MTTTTIIIGLIVLLILVVVGILIKNKKSKVDTTETTTETTTENTTETTTSTTLKVEPVEKLYWKFYRCVGDTDVWMEDSVKNKYEKSLGKFQSGDRFYGAVEGDKNYLYTYTSQNKKFSTTPYIELRGVSRTNDSC